MTLGRDQIVELCSAADHCIAEGDYEPHPERDVEFRRLATPDVIRALCAEVLASRASVSETPRTAPEPRERISVRFCKGCEVALEGRRRDAAFCSDACRARVHRQRKGRVA